MKKIQLIIISLFLISLKGFSQNDTAQTKKAFVPNGKIWGQIFGDYTVKLQTNSFNMSNTQYASIPKDYTVFEFRRIYLGYDYDFSEHFASQFLLSSEGQTASDGSRTIIVKSANLRWKEIFKNADLVAGQMSTSTFSTISDPTWGYRSLEKTSLDLRKIGLSNDVGVSLQGKFNDKGYFGYNLMIGNGTGTKPENDKFKKKYVDFWGKFLNQKLVIEMGGDYETVQTLPYKRSRTTIKTFMSYQTNNITFGLEAFSQLQKNNVIYTESVSSSARDTVNSVASGISLWAKGIINSKLGWVVRYDYYNPDNKFNASNVYLNSYTGVFTESFALAGLDFILAKNIHFIPNIWFDRYTNRNRSFNGLKKSSFDLAARATVFYSFNK